MSEPGRMEGTRPTAFADPAPGITDLDSVISTDALSERPSRRPDHAAEKRALVALAETMGASPGDVLQQLVDTALRLCQAHSAGISLLHEDGRSFHWPVIAGLWASHVGAGTPRDFGPCGTVLDRDAALLFSRPERHFSYLASMTPVVDEALLLPLYVGGKAVGTLWIVAHDQSRRFDAEDLRVMTSLASFGGAAYHALLSLDATTKAHEDLQLALSALRQSEEHYRALFGSIPVAAFVCNSSAVIQSYNRRAVELWGREPQLGVERHCGSLKLYQMDGTLLPHARSPMVEVLRTGIPANDVRVFIERPDGSRIAVNANFAALKDSRGDTIGAITCFEDISARKQAEDALRESEARFRTIVNQASTGVVQADAAGRMTLVNQRWCEMLGYTEAELLRMTIADVTAPESLASTLHAVRLLAEGGPDFVIDKCYRSRDGSRLWATSSVNAVRGPAGEYQGLVAVVLDVSERKQAEAARAALHGQLERELADAQHLQAISTELIQEGNADVLYDHILNAAIAVTHSDMASMQMLSADQSELRLLACKGFDPVSAVFWERVRIDSGSSCGASLRTGQRTVVPDVERCDFMSGTADLESYRQSAIRAVQSTPLVSRSGRVLGMISNHWRQPHQPAQRDLRLLDVLARQAADLIERRRTEALVAGQKRVLEMVAAGAALGDVLAALINVIEEQSDGLLGSILVRQQGGNTCFGMAAGPSLPQGYLDALLQPLIARPGVRPCGVAAQRGEAISVADIAVDERWSEEWRTLALGHGLCSCYSTPIRGSDGTVLGSFGMYSRDQPHSSPDPQLLETATHLAGIAIERKQAEDTLRRRTAQFETLLAEAPLGVYLVDDQFRVREVNPTALSAFGNIPDLIGRDFGEVVRLLWPQAYADGIVDVFRHTLETGEPHIAPERAEQRLDRGVTEYYEWRINRIPLPAGRHGVVCYFRDISAQVFARAAIAESQERLRQAAKMEAIGRLAGGLAHDFNNQLHAVLGFAGYVARDPGIGTRAQLDILEVQKAAERMADLTRQLLAFSRQQVLQPEILDVDEAVADGQELLRRLIGSQIEFRIDREAGAKWVRVDRTQLQQVLMNLCINARDAMPDGGRLEVHTAIHTVPSVESVSNGDRLVPRGKYVQLVVTDTGSGIPAEHLPHIFEPFFTTKEIGRGTGLGLATVDGIVAQSQGYIWADTAPGHGTRFTVLLPLSPEPVGPPSRDVAATRPTPRRSQILVVEDEDIVRSLVARTLRDEGYDVVEASDGREALARLHEHGDTIHLVLSDVMMPVLGGKELGERLASERPHLPLVWMSGYPRDAAFVGGPASTQQPFLQKPVAPEELIATVRNMLTQPQALGRVH